MSAPELLLVDISNSFTKVAPASRDTLLADPVAIPTPYLGAAALRAAVGAAPSAAVVLSSVVPDRDDEVATAFAGLPLVNVSHESALGIEIDYPEPQTVGADRLADAVAAVEFYGAPVVAVDFGTAVTFDIVSPAGAYVGGVIAPGLAAMTDYLFDQTALLPRIDLHEPTAAIGKSTVGAMQAGAVFGYRGLVKEILAQIGAELGLDRAPPVVATGGYASLIAEGMAEIDAVHPNLTLEGLRIIGGLNTPA